MNSTRVWPTSLCLVACASTSLVESEPCRISAPMVEWAKQTPSGSLLLAMNGGVGPVSMAGKCRLELAEYCQVELDSGVVEWIELEQDWSRDYKARYQLIVFNSAHAAGDYLRRVRRAAEQTGWLRKERAPGPFPASWPVLSTRTATLAGPPEWFGDVMAERAEHLYQSHDRITACPMMTDVGGLGVWVIGSRVFEYRWFLQHHGGCGG